MLRFAITASDRYLGVFDALLNAGWEEARIFSVPTRISLSKACIERASGLGLGIGIQLSRIRERDLQRLADDGCEVASYSWRIGGWKPHIAHAINFHPSLLPEFRGPYPLINGLLARQTRWGVTCHKLAPEFDAGDVLAQRAFDAAGQDTHETLDLKTQTAASRLVLQVDKEFPALWAGATPQGERGAERRGHRHPFARHHLALRRAGDGLRAEQVPVEEDDEAVSAGHRDRQREGVDDRTWRCVVLFLPAGGTRVTRTRTPLTIARHSKRPTARTVDMICSTVLPKSRVHCASLKSGASEPSSITGPEGWMKQPSSTCNRSRRSPLRRGIEHAGQHRIPKESRRRRPAANRQSDPDRSGVGSVPDHAGPRLQANRRPGDGRHLLPGGPPPVAWIPASRDESGRRAERPGRVRRSRRRTAGNPGKRSEASRGALPAGRSVAGARATGRRGPCLQAGPRHRCHVGRCRLPARRGCESAARVVTCDRIIQAGDLVQGRFSGGALQPRRHRCGGAETRVGRGMVSACHGDPARVRRCARQPLGHPPEDRARCGGPRPSRHRLSPTVPVPADFPRSAANRSDPLRCRQGKHQPQPPVLTDAKQCRRLDDRIRPGRPKRGPAPH
jgi:hypothetical protein